ncbi:toll/interleukin-1 receptor domain-containing protein [Blastococcus sp. PRF04-17]|uniref:toll/interleukin-1 receptor domain-containing protein n=1 Tax=Blastococcus sp. PRF04-17 TaxID=2933797 RepID=UPI001FF63B06|nr:toll/interleukin-1 receptor domain-containing protein [Blastococcus sp. PRF04-17]UOY00123.1 TIR domain-containing protein [Blastococcus sp. PRF04-17]
MSCTTSDAHSTRELPANGPAESVECVRARGAGAPSRPSHQLLGFGWIEPEGARAMTHVFISYSRRDKEYVNRLAQFLKQAEISVFYDSEIGYSAQWWSTIVRHVDACSAMVVVMTPALDSSDWVTKEVLLARRAGKPIFPLLLEGEGYPLLIDVQHLDVRSGVMPGEDFLHALRTALGLPAAAERARPPDPVRPMHPAHPTHSVPAVDVVGSPVSILSDLHLDDLALKVERAHETLEAWRKLDAVAARQPAMLMMKARALDQLCEVTECLTICTEVLSADPQSSEAKVLKARQLSSLSYYDEALALVAEVLAQHPDHVDALIVQAEVYRDREVDGGEVLIDRALAIEPDNAEALAVKASFFTERQDSTAADRLLSRATALSPGSVFVATGRINHAVTTGQFEKGLEQVEALVRIFPRSPMIRVLQAVVRVAMLLNVEDAERDTSGQAAAAAHQLIAVGLELGAPAGRAMVSLGHFALALLHHRSGDSRQADAELGKAELLDAGTFPWLRRGISSLRAEVGGPSRREAPPGLLAALARFTSPDLHHAPSIPATILTNARAACGLETDDLVLAVVDCTWFGSAKNCIVFTDSFAAQRHSWFAGDQRTRVPYAALPTTPYKARGSEVVNPESGTIWFTTRASQVSAKRVVEMLDAIKAWVAPST